jgi:hypothetical protein
MSSAEAHVPTRNAGRYLARICQHAAKMDGRLRHRPRGHAGGPPPEIRHAESSGPEGTLILDRGRCTLQAAEDTLTLRAEADTEDTLTQIQTLVAARLEKLGHREQLTVTWQRT